MTEQAAAMGQGVTADQLKDLTPEQQRELLQKLLRRKAAGARSFDMSAGQQALWHAFRRDPTSTNYNVFLPSRIRSPLNPDVLRRAVDHQAERHQCLRTTFSDSDGRLTQTVHESLRPEFLLQDLPGASEQEIEQCILEQALRPFDLEKGPLLRQSVFKIANDDWAILAQAHHIVVDFWSLVLILSELRAAYPHFAKGKQPSLPIPQNNYEQFVTSQTKKLSSAATAKKHVDYWQATLKDVAPVVELPVDRNRPAAFTGNADVVGIELALGTGGKTTELATRLRATPFAVVHAAVQLLISRLSRQDQFFVGSPFSGRSQREFEQTVGFFVNVLPIKCDLTGQLAFADLVRRTSRQLSEALDHETYPLSEIVQLGNVPRDPGRSPLFQVSCTLEKSQVKAESGRAGFLFPGDKQTWDFGGLKQESFFLPHPTCHYDIEFIFELNGDCLKGMIVYCRDLFDRQSMEQVGATFGKLLGAVLHDPECDLSCVRSREAIAKQDSADSDLDAISDRTQGRAETVCGQIVAAAKLNADRLALCAGDVRLTYAQVVRAAVDVARQVKARGVQRETLVPVCCAGGMQAIVGVLGVQLAGGAAVPVDAWQPSLPVDELLAQTQATWVVSDENAFAASVNRVVIGDLAEASRNQVDMDELCEAMKAFDEPNRDGLAYMVYTSGSTGVPKGVLVEHSAVCNTLNWRADAVPLEPQDRVLMLLSHQFDAGLGIAWTTLTQGATLIWADDSRDPDSLVDQILRDTISVLPATPSLQELFAAHPRFITCKTLRYLWTGGEAMDSRLPEKMRQLTTAPFWNFYGPTEAAVEATACDVRDHPAGRPVPIGSAITGVTVRVIDGGLYELPDCFPGQIAIGGKGLARGYLHSDELTAERFVTSPVGERLYLTGDIGRKLPNGHVEFLGRDDHQIKLRGYRIELGEIESVISQHPQVKRVAVTVLQEDSPAAHMVAFVSLADSGSERESATSIEQFVKRRLPAYKQPAGVVVLPSLPLTASGKVDRRQLPVSVDISNIRPVVSPSGPIEEFLHQVWADTLGRSDFGVTQTFFEAGGSSIQAAMLTSALTEKLSVQVPTALIFDLADIRQMAGRLAQLHTPLFKERFGDTAVQQALAYSQEQNDTPLITPLRSTGSKTPIFLVHPPGGIVACYRDLAEALGVEQPVMGIRSRGLHGSEPLPASISEMASDYLKAIRSIQPVGPYVIGGWSLGGLVAYEICQQLIASGEVIEKLILLDTTIPEQATELVPMQERENVGLEYGIELSLEQLGELNPEEQLLMLVEHAQKLGVLDEESPPEVIAQVIEDLQELFHHHIELSTQYRMQPLAVPCILIRPEEMPIERMVAHDRGWGHLIDSVAVNMVPGHHHSMVQSPGVEVMAQAILASLNRD